MKCFVISQPKAGTYLATNLLKELGFNFEGLHYSTKSYQQYDLSNLENARTDRKKYTVKKHFSESINLVKENSVGVGHLTYEAETEEILKDFKKILLLRDLKTTTESWAEWAKVTHKSSNSKMINKNFRFNIEKWRQKENVFVLDFFDMKNKKVDKIDQLQLFLFNNIKFNSYTAITQALEKDSLTKIKREK